MFIELLYWYWTHDPVVARDVIFVASTDIKNPNDLRYFARYFEELAKQIEKDNVRESI